MKTSYIALDLETTGLDPQKDQILEIGAVQNPGWKRDRAVRNFCQGGHFNSGKNSGTHRDHRRDGGIRDSYGRSSQRASGFLRERRHSGTQHLV